MMTKLRTETSWRMSEVQVEQLLKYRSAQGTLAGASHSLQIRHTHGSLKASRNFAIKMQ